ncbi:MAG: hypothetical protein WD226_01055 [Planctomycetota bacterium]
MKNLILIALIAGAAAGGAVSLGTALVGGTDAPPARTASTVAPATTTDTSALTQRLAALEERINTLEIRPAALPNAPRTAMNGEAALELEEVRGELAQLRDLTRVLQRPPSDEVPFELHVQVESALDSIREQEERERQERREQAFNERLEQRLAEIKSELGLSGYQVDELRRIELETRAKRDALMRTARDSGDWGNLRETIRGQRDEQAQALTNLFGADLYGRYDELVGRGGLTGGRGDFGGGRGGGGGNGRRGN